MFHTIANDVRLVLASSSPRRREILQATMPGLKFEVRPSDAEENLDKKAYSADPSLFAVDTARLKANDIFDKITADQPSGKLVVVGADTVVAHQGVIYGKPPTKADADTYLRGFSGNTHQVYTGVVILTNFESGRRHETTFSEVTDVTFDVLDDEEIRSYVDTGEPLDKAGGYGIQATTWITKIHGCYFNVKGFPAHKFAKTLRAILKTKV